MKKKLGLVLVSALFLISCSNGNVKVYSGKNEKGNDIKEIKINENRKVREKVKLKNSAFKELKLPIPQNTFGSEIPYLVPINDNKQEDFDVFEEYNEAKALKYFKNLNLRGHGDNSAYWRWKTRIGKRELFSKIPDRLISMYKNNPKNVMTLVGDEWKQVPLKNIGNVKDIIVAARGESGIITHFLVVTDQNKFLIAKEFNVRKLLSTNTALYGAKGTEGEYSAKPIVPNVVSLPSAYLALEFDEDYINIYGGGYGHGVGMSQYAASTLVKDGLDYKKILSRYYYNAKLGEVADILGDKKQIKVGITSAGSLEHSRLTLFSDRKLRIYNDDFDITVGENEKVEVKSISGIVNLVLENGKVMTTSKPLNFATEGEYITISPIKKGHTISPKYRGILTLSSNGQNLRVINTLDIEKYLLQVVPSEMPRSFGVEALKVQAVAARTYAVSDILKGKYSKDGFHIKDTVESQVYNNQVENDDATKAIKETEDEILTYDGQPIDAKYFSTSSGFTSHAHNVW